MPHTDEMDATNLPAAWELDKISYQMLWKPHELNCESKRSRVNSVQTVLTGCARRHVTIANSCHRYNTPPTRLRYRIELRVRFILWIPCVPYVQVYVSTITFSNMYNTVLKNIIAVNRNMLSMDSSRKLRAIVSPNICRARLYRASLKTRATRDKRRMRMTKRPPVYLASVLVLIIVGWRILCVA